MEFGPQELTPAEKPCVYLVSNYFLIFSVRLTEYQRCKRSIYNSLMAWNYPNFHLIPVSLNIIILIIALQLSPFLRTFLIK